MGFQAAFGAGMQRQPEKLKWSGGGSSPTLRTCIHYFHRQVLCPKNARKVSNLAAFFALYPRFYFIKSAYENSEYRFLLNIALLVY